MNAQELFSSILKSAISEVRAKPIPVFTFALYHDHESGAVSVCIDTEENSNRVILEINKYNMGHFIKEISSGNLQSASLWQANIGRNLSLGDFKLVNVARADLGSIKIDEQFYIELVKSLVANQQEISVLSPNPEKLIFACSGANDEVEYVWSL